MTVTNQGTSDGTLDRLLIELRPKLHRYCARMTGSVIDGEDVLQDALLKALEANSQVGNVANVEAWLFRIVHNSALDFLRTRTRREALRSDEDLEMIVDPGSTFDRYEATTVSLHAFMRLPSDQRSTVVLIDVLGHSLREISEITSMTVPAVKAALHRGRTHLRTIAQEPDDRPAPHLSEEERTRLASYIGRFNARDFDAVRDMLADEVQLELVNRTRMTGRKQVGTYFGNYGMSQDWRLELGFVDRRAAVLVFDPNRAEPGPSYFILLHWAKGRFIGIRDFRHARYAIEGAEVILEEDRQRQEGLARQNPPLA